jgi:hypothetical protein
MHNIRLLISRYLDGELTDDEVAQLAALLETNVASIDALVFSSFIHAQLLNWMDQEGEQTFESTTASDRQESLLATMSQPPTIFADGHISKVNFNGQQQSFITRSRKRLLSLGTLAAALLIAASISAITYVVASRPVIVGQLTDATGCRWGASPAGIQVGTLLENDQDLILLQGNAVITFASGAKIHLQGPTSLHLHSPSQIRLNSGRIAAKVPRQAIGFTVASSLARFVDLGTAFTLSLEAEKSFQLHVFEGLIELQLDKRFGKAAQQPVRVAEIHAVSFDVQSGDVARMHFEEGKKMPF